MKTNYHPIHFTLPADTQCAAADGVVLLDARINPQEPMHLNGAQILFTNSWQASRYLQTRAAGRMEFQVMELPAAKLLHAARSAPGLKITIDPCPSCGWHEVTGAADIKSVPEKLSAYAGRVRFIQEQARLSMNKKNYDTAFDMIQKSIEHLDCGNPESHLLIAECALHLKDAEILEQAEESLETFGTEWIRRLAQLKAET